MNKNEITIDIGPVLKGIGINLEISPLGNDLRLELQGRLAEYLTPEMVAAALLDVAKRAKSQKRRHHQDIVPNAATINKTIVQ